MGWMRSAYRLAVFVALLPLLVSCRGELLGDDIRLFNDVPALARAVANEDIDEIEKTVGERPALVDYQEPRFGQTMLIWSILNDRYKSAEKLLQLGADPNLQNKDGLSALMYAAEWHIEEWRGDPKYLRLVLKYGGDPNAIADSQTPPARLGTPLIAAVNSLNLENVRILVEAGADVDYREGCTSALSAAFNLGQVDMVRYFIIDTKADVRAGGCRTLGGDNISVLTYLREMAYPLDSRDYRVKMEVVRYLKARGFDYYKEPVPKHFYKIYSAEFLDEY